MCPLLAMDLSRKTTKLVACLDADRGAPERLAHKGQHLWLSCHGPQAMLCWCLMAWCCYCCCRGSGHAAVLEGADQEAGDARIRERAAQPARHFAAGETCPRYTALLFVKMPRPSQLAPNKSGLWAVSHSCRYEQLKHIHQQALVCYGTSTGVSRGLTVRLS